MNAMKFQFQIEFTLPGGAKMKTLIEGDNEADAVDELFKSVRLKSMVHSIVKPDNDHNTLAGLGADLLDILSGKKT